MVIKRQKEFVNPTVARIINTKPGKAIMNGLIKISGSKGYKNIEKNTEAIGKTIKLVPKNPGAATRRAVAGTVINPGLAGAVAADTGIMVVAPAYAGSPVGLKHLAMAAPTGILKSSPSVQKVGRNMMRDDGLTKASKVGKNIEYYTNKAALGASKVGSIMSNYFSEHD